MSLQKKKLNSLNKQPLPRNTLSYSNRPKKSLKNSTLNSTSPNSIRIPAPISSLHISSPSDFHPRELRRKFDIDYNEDSDLNDSQFSNILSVKDDSNKVTIDMTTNSADNVKSEDTDKFNTSKNIDFLSFDSNDSITTPELIPLKKIILRNRSDTLEKQHNDMCVKFTRGYMSLNLNDAFDTKIQIRYNQVKEVRLKHNRNPSIILFQLLSDYNLDIGNITKSFDLVAINFFSPISMVNWMELKSYLRPIPLKLFSSFDKLMFHDFKPVSPESFYGSARSKNGNDNNSITKTYAGKRKSFIDTDFLNMRRSQRPSKTKTYLDEDNEDEKATELLIAENGADLYVTPDTVQLVFEPELKYKLDNKKTFTITDNDFKCLYDSNWINDTLVDFFLAYYLKNAKEKKVFKDDKIELFNSFFYTSLARGTADNNYYSNVKSWFKNKNDLFDKNFFIIPIMEDSHWYLIIISNLRCLKKRHGDKNETGENNTSIISETQQDSQSNDQLLNDEDIISNPAVDMDDESNKSNDLSLRSKSDSPAVELEKSGTLLNNDDLNANPQTPANIGTNLVKIWILDSLPRRHKNAIDLLKHFIIGYAKDKYSYDVGENEFFDHICHVPRQKNFNDCGIYVVLNVQMMLKDPVLFSRTILKKSMNKKATAVAKKDSKFFYDSNKIPDLREHLRTELFNLLKLQIESEGGDSSNIGKITVHDKMMSDLERNKRKDDPINDLEDENNLKKLMPSTETKSGNTDTEKNIDSKNEENINEDDDDDLMIVSVQQKEYIPNDLEVSRIEPATTSLNSPKRRGRKKGTIINKTKNAAVREKSDDSSLSDQALYNNSGKSVGRPSKIKDEKEGLIYKDEYSSSVLSLKKNKKSTNETTNDTSNFFSRKGRGRPKLSNIESDSDMNISENSRSKGFDLFGPKLSDENSNKVESEVDSNESDSQFSRNLRRSTRKSRDIIELYELPKDDDKDTNENSNHKELIYDDKTQISENESQQFVSKSDTSNRSNTNDILSQNSYEGDRSPINLTDDFDGKQKIVTLQYRIEKEILSDTQDSTELSPKTPTSPISLSVDSNNYLKRSSSEFTIMDNDNDDSNNKRKRIPKRISKKSSKNRKISIQSSDFNNDDTESEYDSTASKAEDDVKIVKETIESSKPGNTDMIHIESNYIPTNSDSESDNFEDVEKPKVKRRAYKKSNSKNSSGNKEKSEKTEILKKPKTGKRPYRRASSKEIIDSETSKVNKNKEAIEEFEDVETKTEPEQNLIDLTKSEHKVGVLNKAEISYKKTPIANKITRSKSYDMSPIKLFDDKPENHDLKIINSGISKAVSVKKNISVNKEAIDSLEDDIQNKDTSLEKAYISDKINIEKETKNKATNTEKKKSLSVYEKKDVDINKLLSKTSESKRPNNRRGRFKNGDKSNSEVINLDEPISFLSSRNASKVRSNNRDNGKDLINQLNNRKRRIVDESNKISVRRGKKRILAKNTDTSGGMFGQYGFELEPVSKRSKNNNNNNSNSNSNSLDSDVSGTLSLFSRKGKTHDFGDGNVYRDDQPEPTSPEFEIEID